METYLKNGDDDFAIKHLKVFDFIYKLDSEEYFLQYSAYDRSMTKD
jgi:hypothetical protein